MQQISPFLFIYGFHCQSNSLVRDYLARARSSIYSQSAFSRIYYSVGYYWLFICSLRNLLQFRDQQLSIYSNYYNANLILLSYIHFLFYRILLQMQVQSKAALANPIVQIDVPVETKTSKKQISKSHSPSSRSRSQKKHKHKHRDNKIKRKKSRSREKEHRNHQQSRGHREYRDNRFDRSRNERHVPKEREKQIIDKEAVKKIPTSVLTESATALQVPMPPIPGGEKRKRERSRSPLNYYRRNQNNNEGEFWDSFSWVPRMNYTPTVSTSALANTKKMRRLMITNVPYQIGITEDDLRNLITRFMAKNYLKDEMNSCPVVNLQINDVDRNVAVELSSVEETCRICKLQKIELLKGHISGIIRLGDSCYGNNVVTQAQTAGQAQAAAFAAINVLQNKKTTFSVDTLKLGVNTTSTVLRVTNAVTSYMGSQLSKQQWKQYQEDLLEGFSQFGTIVHHWFVKKDEKDICADVGNLFVQYESKEEAEKAMGQMNGRIYDERVITMYHFPKEVYYKNFDKNPIAVVLKK